MSFARKDRLSGSDSNGSAIVGIGTLGAKTTIHTVPPLETHTVWLCTSNRNNTTTIELFGNVGAEDDVLNWTQVAETNKNVGPITLVGGSAGTTLELGAVANGSSITVSGTVERYRSQR